MSCARIVLAAVILTLAAPAAATDALESDLVSLERASWVAWKAHDAKFFADFLSDDHLEIHGYGITGKADVVKGVGGTACTVDSYALAQFRFRRISQNAALLVYRAEQKTTCNGAPVPSPCMGDVDLRQARRPLGQRAISADAAAREAAMKSAPRSRARSMPTRLTGDRGLSPARPCRRASPGTSRSRPRARCAGRPPARSR